MNCKAAFPFRLGCTSYVLPDEILPNVRFMADKVDDIELVLFESPERSNLPGKAAILSMQQIAEEHDVTFSVHFPIDRKAGVVDAAERRILRETVLEIINCTRTLPLSGYLLHFEGLGDENDAIEVQRWTDAVDDFCDRVVPESGIDAKLVCIENLAYNPVLHRQLVDKYRFSHCIDVGHLWLYGADWRQHMKQALVNTRIIHLHGVTEQHDHQSLQSHAQQMQLKELASMLKNFSGVLTLEVFGEADTFSSIAYFEELWRQSR